MKENELQNKGLEITMIYKVNKKLATCITHSIVEVGRLMDEMTPKKRST